MNTIKIKDCSKDFSTEITFQSENALLFLLVVIGISIVAIKNNSNDNLLKN